MTAFLFVYLLATALVIGSWSFIFVRLQNPGHVFDFLPDLVARILSLGEEGERLFKPNFLTRPIWKWVVCSVCHSGIFALVYSLASGFSLRQTFILMTFSILLTILLEEKNG